MSVHKIDRPSEPYILVLDLDVVVDHFHLRLRVLVRYFLEVTELLEVSVHVILLHTAVNLWMKLR